MRIDCMQTVASRLCWMHASRVMFPVCGHAAVAPSGLHRLNAIIRNSMHEPMLYKVAQASKAKVQIQHLSLLIARARRHTLDAEKGYNCRVCGGL